MPKNTLFNFAKDHVASSKTTKYAGSTLVCATNAHGVEYARFDLLRPSKVATKVGPYELTEHHVSVYADMIDSSQYHYTGYFTKDKQSYQLHIYFNQQDSMTRGPLLSSKDGQPNPEIDAILSDDFASMALSQCTEVISSLRKDFSQKLIALKTTYQQLEAEATKLSENNPMQDQPYMGKLDKMLSLLKQLTPLEKHDHYERLQQLIMRMKIAYQTLSPVVIAPACAAAAVDDSFSYHDDSVVDKKLASIDFTSVDKEIESLLRDKIAFEPKTIEEKANQLCDLFLKSNELLLLLSDKKYTASRENLRQLYSLDHWIRREGETTLRKMLKKNDYNLLTMLEPFFYTLTQQDIESALETLNATKLDFLIKATGFQTNGQPVKVGQTLYPTAVHYCFQNPNLSNMVSVLSVLIEHGASLLVRDNGLPIAHHLLSDESHPLHNVFALSKKKMGSMQFYKALITELRSPLTKKDKVVVDAIETYTKKSSTLKDDQYLKHIAPHDFNKLEIELDRAAHNPTVSRIKEKLKLDKDLMDRIKQLNDKCMIFLQELSRSQQGNLLKNAKAILTNSNDCFDKLDCALSYEQIRPIIIDRIEKQMQLITNCERLMVLQKKIVSVQRGSVSRQDKKNLTEQANLFKEIKKAESELSVPLEKETKGIRIEKQMQLISNFESLLVVQKKILIQQMQILSGQRVYDSRQEKIDLNEQAKLLQEITTAGNELSPPLMEATQAIMLELFKDAIIWLEKAKAFVGKFHPTSTTPSANAASASAQPRFFNSPDPQPSASLVSDSNSDSDSNLPCFKS